METPSSAATRRITRSQVYAAANNSDNISTLQKVEEPRDESAKSKQRTMKQQDRSALIDITNDSPIVGLAMGKFGTPSSLMSKKSFSNGAEKQNRNSTPGSGEAILRGQVQTLLQKIEEEADISKVLSFPKRPLLHFQDQYFNNSSPMGLILVAPTPANTPQIISNPSAIISDNSIGLASILESDNCTPQGGEEMDLMVTRSLLLDFSEKSECSSNSSKCSSVMTCQEGESSNKATTDDDSSIWSIQVNANSNNDQETDEDDMEEEVINDDDDYYFKEAEETGENDAGLVDELCEAINKINVNGNGQARFCGKRTKFVYNSDEELEGEEVVSSGENDEANSPGALKLQGWPSPKGKHVRFPEAF